MHDKTGLVWPPSQGISPGSPGKAETNEARKDTPHSSLVSLLLCSDRGQGADLSRWELLAHIHAHAVHTIILSETA
jgi:hypothetical protein